MSDFEDGLGAYEADLRSPVARERELAAEYLSDCFEYADIRLETRLRIGNWLIDALWKEDDPIVLESILHALGAANLPEPCPQLPWQRVGEYLPKLTSPLLGEYGLGMLGECGDPNMIAFIEPYATHSEPIVREEARKALDLLGRARLETGGKQTAQCACPGCLQEALPDSAFCAYCEDQHYHEH